MQDCKLSLISHLQSLANKFQLLIREILPIVFNRFKKAGEAPVSLKVVVTPGPAYLGEHFEVTLWVLPDTVSSDWQEGQLSIPQYSVDAIEVGKE